MNVTTDPMITKQNITGDLRITYVFLKMRVVLVSDT